MSNSFVSFKELISKTQDFVCNRLQKEPVYFKHFSSHLKFIFDSVKYIILLLAILLTSYLGITALFYSSTFISVSILDKLEEYGVTRGAVAAMLSDAINSISLKSDFNSEPISNTSPNTIETSKFSEFKEGWGDFLAYEFTKGVGIRNFGYVTTDPMIDVGFFKVPISGVIIQLRRLLLLETHLISVEVTYFPNRLQLAVRLDNSSVFNAGVPLNNTELQITPKGLASLIDSAALTIYGKIKPLVVAIHLMQSSDYQQAERVIRHCLGKTGNCHDYSGYNLLAIIQMATGKTNQAIETLKLGLMLNKNSNSLYGNLGTAYQRLGKLVKGGVKVYRLG